MTLLYIDGFDAVTHAYAVLRGWAVSNGSMSAPPGTLAR